MSAAALSIGNELKDGFKPTDQWVRNGINWLGDIEHFYRERAAIEAEYATKLQNLCNESFKKKAKISTNLSVGDDPVVTPGSLESASLVAWNEILSQTETVAKIHKTLSRDISGKVADEATKLQTKYEGIRARYEAFNTELIKERDSYYDDLSKSKKNYDALCQSMENQRVKAEKSGGDKTQAKLKSKEVDMNIGKNEYLIKIGVANRLKDKYFYQDLPEVLDSLQDLNESRVERLNAIWLTASAIETNHLESIRKALAASDQVVKQNESSLDTAMFVKHNIRQWSEPQDFYYIPSSVWHDDETMITSSTELLDLKKKLNKAITVYEKYEATCNTEKSQLGEIAQQKAGFKKKTMTRETALQFDELISRYVTAMSKFAADDTKRVVAEVEIETIQTAAEGKDLALDAPIETKKKSRLGFLKPHKKSHNTATAAAAPDTLTAKSSNSTVGTHATSSGGAGRLFGSLRNRAQSSASSTTTLPSSSFAVARALYAYDAAGDDETSITAGETLSVIEPDDGGGWTKVTSSNNAEGLVPTSYIELIQQAATTPQKKQGPKVAPRRGAKKLKYCEALYDYSSAGDDEIDLKGGDRIAVTLDDDGSGWTEGEINGRKGLFPTSYVKFV